MRRADRLFRLVQLLRQRRFATAEDLADALSVSKRTVYRDIRDLQESDVPIRGEAGVGYTLERGFELPPMSFTTAEIEALVLGARMVQAWGDPELAQAAAVAIEKIEAVIPAPMRAVLDDAPLYSLQFGGDPAADDRLVVLRTAIRARRQVRFSYVAANGSASQREVRPLGLYFMGRTWTLAAWDPARADYRSFRPDRMTDLSPSDIGFDPADGIDLDSFIAAQKAEPGFSGVRVRGG